MSETPQNLLPLDACTFHLVSLNYLLAGDLDSVAAIDLLLRRVSAIDWNAPDFIESSEQMRAGLNSPPPGATEFPEHMLRAILHTQGEALSEIIEERRVRLIQMKEFKEQLQTIIGNDKRIQKFADALLSLAIRMRDRLELLNDDVSDFKFPEL
jgi:hypothetical protein